MWRGGAVIFMRAILKVVPKVAPMVHAWVASRIATGPSPVDGVISIIGSWPIPAEAT